MQGNAGKALTLVCLLEFRLGGKIGHVCCDVWML